MTMQHWEPFPDFGSLENRLSRMWRRFPTFQDEGFEVWTVPLDIREEDGKLIVEASVPGVKAEEIEVEIEDDVIAIKGETKTEREEKKKNYLLKERSEGSYYRSVRLPEGVDSSSAESTYKDGVLTVTLSKKPMAHPKKVTVKVG